MATCRAALNVKGAAFQCDLDHPHAGWAHGNRDADAVWCSDGEARRYAKKGQVDES